MIMIIVVITAVEFEWVALMVMSTFLLTTITECVTAFADYSVTAYVLLYYSVTFYALFVLVKRFYLLLLHTPVCACRISMNMRG